MHLTRNRSRFRVPTVLAVALIAVAPVVVTASAASAAPGGSGAPGQRPAAAGVSADVLAAVQRDLGLTKEQATLRIAQQTLAIQADRKAKDTLGPAFAGSWFDAASGKLVVASTDAGKASRAATAGVRVRTVKHSKVELDGIRSRLDALAGNASSDLRVRPAPGPRDAAVAGLTGWYVDPKTNAVVVTTVAGQPLGTATTALLAQYGDAVRVEQLPAAPRSASNYLDGGDGVNGDSCSAGFNLRNPTTGVGYLLIAGHCVTAGTTLTGQGGVAFGPVLERWFPTFDDAIVRNDSGGYWIQGPWVDTNPSNGSIIIINGYSDAPVGTFICKSGITTKLTCGYITGKDETVTFDGTSTVYGMTRHSACVEKGDSGGSNFVATSSPYTAEGTTTGAVLTSDITGRLRCGAHVGQETISWYFPIAHSLPYYASKYGVGLW